MSISHPNVEKGSDTNEIFNFLRSLKIFNQLDVAAIQSVVERLTQVSLSKGQTLFQQGDQGNALYVLVSGLARVSMSSADGPEVLLHHLQPGECTGEMALLTGQPRTATVSAEEDSQLLCLKKEDYGRLAELYPGLQAGLANQLLPRFQQNQTREALKKYFGDVGDAVLLGILKSMDCCHCDSGQVLFNQGEPGDAMYIITQGRLRLVSTDAEEGERILGEAGAGECVGEFALLAESGTPGSLRTATVYATRSTDLVLITRPVFENLMVQYPQALMALTRRIVRRALSIGKPTASQKANLVVSMLPIQAGFELGDFADQLSEALSGLGPTLSLNAERFEDTYGKSGASALPLNHPLSPVINAWLDEKEREHLYTIYEAVPAIETSGHLSTWARRCVEDADLILLVGDANSSPLPTEVEKAMQETRTCARVELVLLHENGCALPTGTANWLTPRSAGALPVRAHHHIRSGNPADFRRLARRLAGKAVGIAFAGGAARGWAHIGALRALEETGIEVDWVAGASMGSIIAAGCALDWSSKEFNALAARFSDPKKLLDYTFPYASFTATKYISSLLKELFKDDIEDTWKPFFCISTNLTQTREIVHTHGELWKALRASMAFPGVFAPVLNEEGCVLMDGGAVNNLPVDRMREMCPTGTVIGLDLVTSSSFSEEYHFGYSLSGWKALLGHIVPFPGKTTAPDLFKIMSGLVEGACKYRLNEVAQMADLLIRLPVQPFGLLEFERFPEISEAGYRAAQEQLKGFKVN